MEIRPVQPDEHEEVGELTVNAYLQVETSSELDEYVKELRDVASRAMDADVLVAVDGDGALLGAVTYVPGPDSSSAEFTDLDAAGIRMLAVDPGAQRRGVGELLVRACIDRARAVGRAQLLLHSTDAMATAHRLYQRLGFEREPANNWHPGPDLWLRAFRLKL